MDLKRFKIFVASFIFPSTNAFPHQKFPLITIGLVIIVKKNYDLTITLSHVTFEKDSSGPGIKGSS